MNGFDMAVGDVYSADENREKAGMELLLVERHHTAYPHARCIECENAHIKTASALLIEAARMKDGDKEDLDLATKTYNLDITKKDSREFQQDVRKVRKAIFGRLGISDCDKGCSISKYKKKSGQFTAIEGDNNNVENNIVDINVFDNDEEDNKASNDGSKMVAVVLAVGLAFAVGVALAKK